MVICGSCSLCAAQRSGAEDPLIEAATRALDAGQSAQAVVILTGQPQLPPCGQGRVLLARAYVGLGSGAEALTALEAAAKLSWLQAWPEAARGAAAQWAGEAELLEHHDQTARWYLGEACLNPGDGMDVDRCLALLAELVRHDGKDTALQYATIIWRDWPHSPYHGHAGVMLAEGLAAAAPEKARSILAAARLESQLSASDRLVAAELLCRLLLTSSPSECLVVAQLELSRLAQGQPSGQLLLYRALALTAINAREGLSALQALPPDLHDEPSAQAAVTRLTAAGTGEGAQQTPVQVIEQAKAQAGLGDSAAARRLLEPLAPTHLEALAALVDVPGMDLALCTAYPTVAQPQGAYILGSALLRSGNTREAWPLVRRALQARDSGSASDIPLVELLDACYRAAASTDPSAVTALQQRLLELDEPGAATGMAWCRLAEERDQAHADAQTAWEKGARLLPADHPWKASAAWRAARPLLALNQRLVDCLSLLDGPAWSGTSADQLRCRFLLAQAAERHGDKDLALRAATSLLPLGDAQQKEHLHHLIQQLDLPEGPPP